jgi:hypothetical protein
VEQSIRDVNMANEMLAVTKIYDVVKLEHRRRGWLSTDLGNGLNGFSRFEIRSIRSQNPLTAFSSGGCAYLTIPIFPTSRTVSPPCVADST